MKPWREVAVPHRDVLEGSFQQAEFAADITAVNTGKAPHEYQDAVAFFERTFITEGMGMLLIQVVLRLSGKGGEPVIQLQTAFGGGKTHTELAVYHLATRTCALSDLAGIPALIDRAGLMEVPRARVAVARWDSACAGAALEAREATYQDPLGKLAWQLGGEYLRGCLRARSGGRCHRHHWKEYSPRATRSPRAVRGADRRAVSLCPAVSGRASAERGRLRQQPVFRTGAH